jgi:hypothetical protein
MTAEQRPGDEIRAGDQDRAQILGILDDALEQGRITPVEHGERGATVAGARTMGELRLVVDDLPVAAMRPDLVPAADVGPGEAVEWRGSWSSMSRKGDWTVPARIVLRRRMGSVKLDFTNARFTSPTVDIALDVIGGSIEIRLPEGASARTDEVEVVLGSVEDHRKRRAPGGRPHLRFHGTVKMGSLEIRGPRRRLIGGGPGHR